MVWPTRWLIVLLSISLFDPQSFAESQSPIFAKKKISLGKIVLNVEVAETPSQMSYGLMYREKLPEGQGMIFIFPDEQPRSFWMKNTIIDLSIGYFDKNKVLFQILDMKATSLMQKEFPSYKSSSPAQYALEVPKGWFGRHGVKQGDKFQWR